MSVFFVSPLGYLVLVPKCRGGIEKLAHSEMVECLRPPIGYLAVKGELVPHDRSDFGICHDRALSCYEVLMGNLYAGIGIALGGLSAAAVFIGAWAHCVATYGFLFGLGLGWLPAAISAGLALILIRWLWLPIIAVLAFAFLKASF